MTSRYLTCLGVLALLCVEVNAQSELNWSDATYSLTVRDGELNGPGAERLMHDAGLSQFVIFGEQHGVKGLPEVVAASFRQLFSQGYRYLALEMDPWLATRINADGIDTALHDAPHSLAFDYNDEILMMKSFHSIVGTEHSIWGLDQPVTAIHSYERLSQILPTRDARRKARGLFLKAAIQAGGYLKQNNSLDLARLRQAVDTDLPAEAELILSSVETSMKIYVSYLAGQRGDGPRGVSDGWREQYMKDLLQQRLDQAEGDSDRIPKVIFKMGGAHLMEGIGPNGVETLGEFAQQIATGNNLDALNIGIRAWNDDSGVPETVFAGENTIVLIDTRKLRSDIDLSQEATLSERLRRDISQFDSLIYLHNPLRDSNSHTRKHEIAFRNNLIYRVAFMLLPLAVMLTTIIPWGRVLFAKIRHRVVAPSMIPLLPWAILGISATGIAALVGLQISRFLAAASPEASALSGSSIPLAVTIVAGCIVCGLGLLTLSRRWWTAAVRTHFLIVCIATCALLGSCVWWNLGGMLG